MRLMDWANRGVIDIVITEKQAAGLLVAAIKKIIEKDRSNSYANETEIVYRLHVRTPKFDCRWFGFEPQDTPEPLTLYRLKKYGKTDNNGESVCDGASFAIDGFKGVVPATKVHDPGYIQLDDIAEAWKDEPYNPGPHFKRDAVTRLSTPRDFPTWTAVDVRQLLDAMFGDLVRKHGGASIIVRAYYSTVRYFGGLFRRHVGSGRRRRRAAAPLVAGLLAGLAVGGCQGCMAPPDIIVLPDAAAPAAVEAPAR